MKKIAALFFFCSTTFLMGMIQDTNVVNSKLKTKYKEFHESFDSAQCDKLDNFYLKYLFSRVAFEKILDENFKKNSFYKEVFKPLVEDLKKNDPLYKELCADLDLVSSNPISNEDYKNYDTTLKFVSNQSESIYKGLLEIKEKYPIISNSFKCDSCYHSFNGFFRRWATKLFLAIGCSLQIKTFKKSAGNEIEDSIKCCITYEKKKQDKKLYEDLKSFAHHMYKLTNIKAHSLKPIFPKYIREKENDKLSLLDIKIKTVS